MPAAASLAAVLAAGVLDEDAAHGLGGGGEEVAAAVPVLVARSAPTSRRYASWTRAVAWSVWPGFSWASFCGRQLAQLVVDQRQQLLGGVRVALLDGGQDAGDVGHDRPAYPMAVPASRPGGRFLPAAESRVCGPPLGRLYNDTGATPRSAAMSADRHASVLRQSASCWAHSAGDGPTDAELLRRFTTGRDETAFELLVWRHAELVLSACRHLLRDAPRGRGRLPGHLPRAVPQGPQRPRGEALAGWLHRSPAAPPARLCRRGCREVALADGPAARPRTARQRRRRGCTRRSAGCRPTTATRWCAASWRGGRTRRRCASWAGARARSPGGWRGPGAAAPPADSPGRDAGGRPGDGSVGLAGRVGGRVGTLMTGCAGGDRRLGRAVRRAVGSPGE